MREDIKERIEMINRGEVPEGYKKIGSNIVPQKWVKRKIKDIAEISTGGTPDRNNDTFWNGDIPWVTTSLVDFNVISQTDEFITEEGLKNSAAKIMPVNTIIMAMYGQGLTRGKVAVLGIPATTNQACCGISVSQGYFYKFIFYSLTNHYTSIRKLSNNGNQKNLNTNIIKEYEILLGSYIEQEKIVSIISTWDRAIELKEKLLEQKRLQKKGLMEKLLTGKVRLAPFKTQWKKTKLGEIFVERKETGETNLELLSITATKGICRRDEVEKIDTSSEDKSKYKIILPYDIGYNTMRMWQGVSGVSQYKGIVSPAYTVVTPKKGIDPFFMGYLFKTPKTIHDFLRFSQGLVDDTLNLTYENFRQVSVLIPIEIEEQQAISSLLMSSDKEISIIEKEINELKHQKKGLMQLLLTGKVRTTI